MLVCCQAKLPPPKLLEPVLVLVLVLSPVRWVLLQQV
jgi:hypothetical protein